MSINLDEYVDVAERIQDFKAAFPDGSLRPADPEHPYRVETIGDKTFIVYAAAAFRQPNDPSPGIGIAWEPFPGKTPYTRDSELQNAETSAWGRAIVAVLASTTKKIASAQDVRNRDADRRAPDPLVALKRRVWQAQQAIGIDSADGAQADFEARNGPDADLRTATEDVLLAYLADLEAEAVATTTTKSDEPVQEAMA